MLSITGAEGERLLARLRGLRSDLADPTITIVGVWFRRVRRVVRQAIQPFCMDVAALQKINTSKG
jgi:hypothetical protein